jgi:ParB family chromosome partitioning protein
MSIITVKLNKLRIAETNVRKAYTNIEPLAASIAAHGLLQKMRVAPSKKKGFYDVFAGGRRLRAFQYNVEQGLTKADIEIDVELDESDENTQREKSTAENTQRVAMTAADEVRAFKEFMGDRTDAQAIADVAKRFGCTENLVSRRLRLANLADPIFNALAEGKITLDVAAAYAATDDQAKQLTVWDQAAGLYTNASTIKRQIQDGSIPSTSPVAILVGAHEYTAAGGRIECDLFANENDAVWLDGDIANNLAMAKMEAQATIIAAEHNIAWVTPILQSYAPHEQVSQLHRYYAQREPLNDKEQANIEQLQTKLASIYEAVESGDLAEDEAQKQIGPLEKEYERICAKSFVIPEAMKPHIGHFLLLTREGTIALDAALYSTVKSISLTNDETGEETVVPVQKGAGDPAKLSAKLVEELSVQRRDILSLHVANNPQVALDLTIFQLALKTAGIYDYQIKTNSIVTMHGSVNPSLAACVESPASQQLQAIRNSLDMSWYTEHNTVASFVAFMSLPEDAKAAWLAFAVSSSLVASLNERDSLHNWLGRHLDIDAAAFWRPTAANFFDRVSKTVTMAALADVGGPGFGAHYANCKKADLAAAAEKIFAGDFIESPEIKAKALSWTPAVMQFDSAASEEPPLVQDEAYADDNQFEAGGNIEAETASEPEPAEEV